MTPSPDIAGAVQQLLHRLSEQAPHLTPAVRTWMEGHAGGRPPQARFLQDLMYPVFDMPLWVEEAIGRQSEVFRFDLTYSTLSGYYLIRLIDDLVDRRRIATVDDSSEVLLLTVTPFLHSEFHQVYMRYFDADDAFWEDFRAYWVGSFEALYRDAGATVVDPDFFASVSSRKLSAVNVPVAAVCHRAKRLDALPDWLQFCDSYGAVHQAIDDLLDWYEDHRDGNASGFLSRGLASKGEGESLPEWVVREGFASEVTALQDRLETLCGRSRSLGSAAAEQHIGRWRKAVEVRIETNARALQALRQVGQQFGSDRR